MIKLFSFRNKKQQQVLLLFVASLIGIPISLISNIILTKYLGDRMYGDYSLIFSIFTFSIVVFDFGFFHAGNRALVLNNNKQKAKEYYAIELLILFGLYLLMSIFLIMYSFIDNNLKQKGLTDLFILVIPLGLVYLMPKFYENLFQADNRIKELAFSRLLLNIGHLLAFSLAFYFFNFENANKLKIVFIFYFTIDCIIFTILLFIIKPVFSNFAIRIKEIWQYTKEFGFHVYSGSVIAVGMGQLSGILLSYFSLNNISVGYYTLALAFSMPLKLIPNIIASTHYKDFSTQNRIPRKLTIITLIISATAFLMLLLIITPFVKYFYGINFLPVIPLTIIISISMLFFGLADYLNRFLGSHGRGKLLRNSAILTGLSILISNLVLIPMFNVLGAAFAQLISGFIYLASMFYYYNREKF